jgi:hypothetical protein
MQQMMFDVLFFGLIYFVSKRSFFLVLPSLPIKAPEGRDRDGDQKVYEGWGVKRHLW